MGGQYDNSMNKIKGFSIIAVVIIAVVALAAIGGGVWYFQVKTKQVQPAQNNIPQQNNLQSQDKIIKTGDTVYFKDVIVSTFDINNGMFIADAYLDSNYFSLEAPGPLSSEDIIYKKIKFLTDSNTKIFKVASGMSQDKWKQNSDLKGFMEYMTCRGQNPCAGRISAKIKGGVVSIENQDNLVVITKEIKMFTQ